MGMGPIGREVARLTAAVGMKPIGFRRNPAGDEPCETWGPERFSELLALADVVVAALPLTPDTEHLLDRCAIQALKPGTYFVNVGRGGVIDQGALVEALETGALAGAALDVFETEPLPPESRLWHLPNVIVTPHSAANTETTRRRGAELFVDNLARFAQGRPLLNIAPLRA